MFRDDVLAFLSEHKQQLAEQYGVTKLGLVGSVARGEETDASDIDIIVSLESSNRFRSFFGLLHFLQDSFPQKIDLATEASLKPLIRQQIMKDIRYV